MFTKDFDTTVIPGDTIICEVDGFRCEATIYYDEDAKLPDDMEETNPAMAKAWQRDEWQYFGVAVTVWREGCCLTGEFSHALWGIEGNLPRDGGDLGDNSYFREVANSYLPEALADAKATIAELAKAL